LLHILHRVRQRTIRRADLRFQKHGTGEVTPMIGGHLTVPAAIDLMRTIPGHEYTSAWRKLGKMAA
jgi:hypothetical protein